MISWVSICLPASAQNSEGSVPDLQEYNALRDLYLNLNGAGWTNKTNWPSTWTTPVGNAVFDTWHGVAVSNGDVVSVDLSYNNLAGALPNSIGGLEGLLHLFLAGNAINGSLPVEVCSLPELINLHLFSNQLIGSIPPEIGNLKKLQELRLSINQMSGSIPQTIGRLKDLRTLDLTNNGFSGNLPDSIGRLTSLLILAIHTNSFTGPIPATIGNLTLLRSFQAYSNGFTSIPDQIGGLVSLTGMYLYNNQLEGRIPPQIKHLVNLQELRLSNNKLSDVVSPGIGNLNELTVLDLANNQLEGNLPVGMDSLTLLQVMDLSTNKFSGPMPPMGHLSKLVIFNAYRNEFTALPTDLHGFTSLRELRVYNNKLADEFPQGIGALTELSTLTLYNNLMIGSIPDGIRYLTKLTGLDLSNNRLSGPLPDGIGYLSSLSVMVLAGNSFSGPIPNSFVNLSNLDIAWINQNQFTSLPSGMATMPKLSSLWVYSNNLTFSSIIPIKQLFAGQSFSYPGQALVDEERTFNAQIGDPYELSAPVDKDVVPACKYQWFKKVNGVVTAINETPAVGNRTISLPAVTLADEGTQYYYFIFHDLAPDLGLQSNLLTLHAVSCPTAPIAYGVSGGGTYCTTTGADVSVTLSGSETDVTYVLKKGGITYGSSQVGTGLPLTWSGVPTGVYTVVATRESCTLQMNGSANITVNLTLTMIDQIVTQGVSCAGGSDGTLSFQVSHGAGPYTVKLLGGNLPAEGVVLSSYSRTGLTSGVYSISATDSKGCTITTTATIGYGGALFSEYCDGNVGSTASGCTANGTTITTTSAAGFTVTKSNPAGGNAYTYHVYNATGAQVSPTGGYNGTFGTRSTINNLPAGTYRIVVAYNGCSIATTDAGNRALKVEALDMRLSADIFSTRKSYPDQHGTGLVLDYCTLQSCGSNVTITPKLAFGNALSCTNLGSVARTFKLFKKNGSGVYAQVGSSLTNTGSFTIDMGTLLGEYRIEASLQNYGCASPVEFEIREQTPPAVTLMVSPETCPGDNNGSVEISASGHLVSPVTYALYTVSGDDICSRVPVTGKSSAVMTGLAPGKYCVKILDSRNEAVSCKCHPFEVFSGDYQPTPILPAGDRGLWPYSATPKSPLAATYALASGSCGATVTASFGTPPYRMVWKREVQEKRPVFVETPAPVHYDEVEQTIERTLLTVSNMTGLSSSSDLQSGKYKVYVTDACSTTPVIVTFTIPVPARTYNLCFRWTTGDIDDQLAPAEEPKTTTISAITASSISRQLSDKAAECVTAQVAAATAEQKQRCLSLEYLEDEMELTYNINYFHYTLYYYDRAGKLVRTVAPNGVKPTATDRSVVPLRHDFVTQYDYNTLGQQTGQHSPDAGQNDFIYNAIGQLRFSQSDKQRDPSENNAGEQRYSYTKYDVIGRVTEVGESVLSGTTFSSLSAYAAQLDYPATTSSIRERVNTYYSDPATVTYQGKSQRNLLNRVSYSVVHNKNGKVASTYYSYDAHGNVEWLVQDIPGLTQLSVGYTYDLISNKVLKVSFNEYRPDQFYQRYQYDEDNVLTSVETSRDGYQWDRDASYTYYDHGPLRSVGLGEDHLQKLDYVYTLQGWLKGINTPDLSANGEEGADKLYAQDKFGMGLGYYQGDFFRTYNGTNNAFNWKTGSAFYASNGGKDLFNGNISTWISKIGENRNMTYDNTLTAQVYTYDRLNRIKSSRMSVFTTNAYNATDNYGTSYTYDGNGNILTLTRNANSGSTATLDAMDDLSYVYSLTDNKLRQVVETAAANSIDGDMEAGQVTDNYVYDKAGNLIEDKQQQIYISWNVFGKVSEVKPYANTMDKPHVVFTYDAQGNRIIKEVNSQPYNGNTYLRKPEKLTSTYYVRDAAGNLLGIYERKNTVLGTESYKAAFTLKELPLYGSDRLGQLTPDQLMSTAVFTANDVDNVSFDVESVDRKHRPVNLMTLGRRYDAIKVSTATRISNSVHAQLATYDKVTNKYVPRVQSSFWGNATSNLTVAEDTVGNIQAYSVTAEDYWGRDNVCLIYDRNGNLMPSSNGIFADPKAKSVMVRQPGTTNYLLITLNTAGKLMYHTIDTRQPGNSSTELLGDVIGKNVDLDAAKNINYGRQLLAVEDRINDRTIIYATRYIAPTVAGEPGIKQIVSFTLTDKVIAQQATILATLPSYDKEGDGELQLDGTGRNLVVVNYGKMRGWTWQRRASLHVFKVNADMALRNADGSTTSVLPANSVTIAEGSLPVSVDFSTDGTQFMYSQRIVTNTLPSTENEALWSTFMGSSTQTLVQSGVSGEVRRGKDNRMHVATRNSTTMKAYEQNSTGILVSQPVGDVTLAIASGGYLSNQVMKVYPGNNLQEGIYGRIVGSKYYELKDHLGNVTVVVPDEKKATLSGLIVTNYMEAASHTNYYPFGMQMPLRYGPGNNVANDGYRYGFNGKEKDDSGEFGGTVYDYGFRIYNPSIAKFLSVDPLTKKYPELTPYQFASNRPIDGIDLDGLEYFNSTTMTYTEAGAGIGWVYGATVSLKQGTARDMIGRTQFVLGTVIHPGNQDLQPGSKNPKAVMGAGLGLDIGIDIVRKPTFAMAEQAQALSMPLDAGLKAGGGFGFSIGDGVLGFSAGIGVGALIKTGDPDFIIESISFTYKEGEQIDNVGIDGGTLHLADIKEVFENEKLTGYSAEIFKFDPKQNKRVSTGVTVFSGIDTSGDVPKSNGIYKTKEYQKQEQKYDEAESSEY